MAGFGIQTAAVSAGGATLNPDTRKNGTEEYDGSSWTSGNNMPNFYQNIGSAGILTAALTTAGKSGPSATATTDTLEYDGTNWSSGNAIPISPAPGTRGMGTQTDALFAGFPSTNVLSYDGTNFATSASTSVSHSTGSAGGTASSGLIAGGYNSPADAILNATEEFTGAFNAAREITTS